MPGECEQVMVIQPKLADDYETDQPAKKLWQKIDKLVTELVYVSAIVQNRHFEFENEQRHDNCKHAIAEPSIRLRPSAPCVKRFNKSMSSPLLRVKAMQRAMHKRREQHRYNADKRKT